MVIQPNAPDGHGVNTKQKDHKMKTLKIEFSGIDSWNRPIFQSVDLPRRYYGATDVLFSYNAEESEVLARIGTEDLTYFGNEFDCEPMGTAAAGLVIIKA